MKTNPYKRFVRDFLLGTVAPVPLPILLAFAVDPDWLGFVIFAPAIGALYAIVRWAWSEDEPEKP